MMASLRAVVIAVAVASVTAQSAFAGNAAKSTSGEQKKTIRFSFLIAETSFDPQVTSDLYSNTINDAIF